jgi:hypothetical protein
MALVQFENDHKKLLARYKQKADPDTSKALIVMDLLAKRLAAKDLTPDKRESLGVKLKDAMKKVKLAIKEDVAERTKAHANILKKPPEDFDVQSATRNVNNVKRELLLLQKKAQTFTDNGGNPPPPPKLQEFHFGADYKRLIAKFAAKADPGVTSALDKLDENHDAEKAIVLIGASRVALEKQATALAGEAGKSKDPKEKVRLAALSAELLKMRKELKELEVRIFLIHRLKS